MRIYLQNTILVCSLFFSCLVYSEFFSAERLGDISKTESGDSIHQDEPVNIIMKWNEKDNRPEVAGMYYPDREEGQPNFELLWAERRYIKNCMLTVSKEGGILEISIRSKRCVSPARRFIRQLLLHNVDGIFSENKVSESIELSSNENDSIHQDEPANIIMKWNEKDDRPEVAGMYYPDREEGQPNFELLWTGERYIKNCVLRVSDEGDILDVPVRSRRCVVLARRFIHQFLLNNERFTDNNEEEIFSENKVLESFEFSSDEDKSEFISSKSEVLPKETQHIN